jgi:hypothetical protein
MYAASHSFLESHWEEKDLLKGLHVFVGVPNPDPLVTSTEPGADPAADPDPSLFS